MSAIHEHIANKVHEDNGIYQLTDDKTGEALALECVEIHQPVRKHQQEGRYFACPDFRSQGAKFLELRAVRSLGRLWQAQDKCEETRQILQETYHWFTEGFDTHDLQEVQELLAALQ